MRKLTRKGREAATSVPDQLEPEDLEGSRIVARVIALGPIPARELVPGDLFSTYGPSYWAAALDAGSVGEATYIRTNVDAELTVEPDAPVYRLVVSLTRSRA